MERGFVEKSGQKQEVIFIHIPKTGGSSISKALRQCTNFEKVPSVKTYSWENFSRKIRGIPKPARHPYARRIKSIMTAKRWNSSFSFAFVRNPWDLMVSAYVFLSQKGSSYAKLEKYSEQIKKMDNFSEFMKSDFGRYQILEYKGNMRDWLCDDNQKILVNFVGKLENFNEDWHYVCQRIGLNCQQFLPHEKKTERKKYQDYYNEETKKMVDQRFEWVIKEFGYTF